jgi:hypothetical protein
MKLAVIISGLFLSWIVAQTRADNGPATQPTTRPAKAGAFAITFTRRSHESEYSKLVGRIGLARNTLGADYDLTREPMVAYVPAGYDPQKPIGLIVQIWQDGSPEIYQLYRPVLDDMNLMMIATQRDHRPLLNAVGLCFDAVYNLRQIYNIDPSRIYFCGLGQTEEPIGWSTGDLFMGDLYIWWVGYNRPLNGQAPLFAVNPPPRLMNLVESHMQILSFPKQNGADYWQGLVASTMRNDGFEYVKVEPVDHDHILDPNWFRARIQQLELVKSRPISGHGPATAPSTADDSAKLLRLAQAYIDSGLTDRAREKLNLLIQKYPDSPAAVKATEMLNQLNNQ